MASRLSCRSRLPWLLNLVVLSTLTTGCVHHEYEVEMSLGDEGLHREVVGWRVTSSREETTLSPLPAEELQRWQAAYPGQNLVVDETKAMIAGLIPGLTPDSPSHRLPDDLGGSGTVTRWSTSLGSLTQYRERIRGSDELVTRWEQQVSGIDRWCELVGNWVTREAVTPAAGAELQQFVSGPLREDLQNLALHLWMYKELTRRLPAEDMHHELVVRLFQFADERGYLPAAARPRVERVIHLESPEEWLALLSEMLQVRRGEADRPLQEVLPIWSSPEKLHASWSQFLADTPEGAALRESTDPQAVPDYLQILSELLIDSLGIFQPAADRVRVKFLCELAPVVTNGTWSPADRCILWELEVERLGETPPSILPTLLYADWAVPNETAQRACFGQVLLQGESLADYVLWVQGLDASQAAEWEQFLSRLIPSQDWASAVARFRFTGEPQAADRRLPSDRIREIIQRATLSDD